MNCAEFFILSISRARRPWRAVAVCLLLLFFAVPLCAQDITSQGEPQPEASKTGSQPPDGSAVPASGAEDAAGEFEQLLPVLEGMQINTVTINVEQRPWSTGKVAKMAGEIVSLRDGDAFRALGFKQSLADLWLSKRFEDIRIDFAITEKGLDINVKLKPARVIKDIKINGAYPLFKSDILKVMSVYTGDSLRPDTFAVQEKLIKEFYKREGFDAARIKVSGRPDDTGGTETLYVDIKPGRATILGSLSLKDNYSISGMEILARMDSWRNSWMVRGPGRFRREEFDQDVKKLKSLYWQRGYPQCEITTELEKDADADVVNVSLQFDEGPKTIIEFSGNRHFSAFRLKKALTIFKDGNRQDRGIRKDREQIRQFYQSKGFPFAEVGILREKITIHKGIQRIIEYQIEEGSHTKLEGIRFSGNTGLDSKQLADLMTSNKRFLPGRNYYVAELVEDDLITLKSHYQGLGYQAVQIKPKLAWNKERTRVLVTIQITEGVRTLVSSVNITGLDTSRTEQAYKIANLKPGQAFSRAQLLRVKDNLAEYIAENGYPHVEVKESVAFSQDQSLADITFNISSGKLVHMGNIYYRGNFKTKERVLRRELRLEPGDPFSPKAMLKGQKNIRDMGVFNNVQFKTFGLKEKADTITLLVDMEEVKPYYVQTGGGYESTRGLYCNAKVGNRNLAGNNYNTWLGGERSQIGYNGTWDISQQNILGSQIAANGALSYERKEELNQDFGTKVGKASLGFSRPFEKLKLKTVLSFSYEKREAYALNDDADPDDIYDPRGIFVTTPTFTFDMRDSFVRPRKGTYSAFSVDISHGIDNSFDDFFKYSVDLRGYITPLDRLTFAGYGRASYIETLGNDNTLPDDQLLYLGGTFSVRGYAENMLRYDESDDPVGGRVALSASLEARYEFSRSWEATIFYDTGAVRRTYDSFGTDAFRSSYGLGLRYVTPIGPMGLLYGRKINPREDESRGRYHFSLGYTF